VLLGTRCSVTAGSITPERLHGASPVDPVFVVARLPRSQAEDTPCLANLVAAFPDSPLLLVAHSLQTLAAGIEADPVALIEPFGALRLTRAIGRLLLAAPGSARWNVLDPLAARVVDHFGSYYATITVERIFRSAGVTPNSFNLLNQITDAVTSRGLIAAGLLDHRPRAPRSRLHSGHGPRF
jgi:hypothetical protein